MKKIDMNLSAIPKEALERPARALLAAVARDFQDPAVAADFQRWLSERQQRQQGSREKGATA